jgi:isoleucyl-tRNA synthetase
MLVINQVLFGKSPYKNVVVHGMLMAEDGKKMSKSLNNYPPMDKILNKYGADSLRLFLLTSSVVRGDSPAFLEKGVDEVSKKIIMKSKNILSFYNMYKDKVSEDRNIEKSKNILDI